MSLHVDWDALSDPGNSRKGNEDQMLLGDLKNSMLVAKTTIPTGGIPWLSGEALQRVMIVADGLGGNSTGGIASSLAVSTLSHYLVQLMPWSLSLTSQGETDLIDDLKMGLQKSQESLQRVDDGCSKKDCMATSMTMAFIVWPRMYIIHAGHTRAYLYRGGKLTRLTTIHSVAQQLADGGVIKEDNVEDSPWNKVIWNTVGGAEKDLKLEVRRTILQTGDDVLLCTNGLCMDVSDERIAAILSEGQPATIACRALIGEALSAGGSHNATVAIARFGDADNK